MSSATASHPHEGRNRRVRILIAALSYHRDFPTGASRLALDEAEYLAARGHEVWLVAPDLAGGAPEYTELGGVHLVRYHRPIHKRFDPRMYRAHQHGTRRALLRHAGSRGFDAIHGHAALQYAEALHLFGSAARTAYTVHSPIRQEKWAEARAGRPMTRLNLLAAGVLLHRLERRVIERSDTVSALSDFSRGLIGRAYGAAQAERTRIVPGWVDLETYRILQDPIAARRQLGIPTDVPVFFTLRRLVPRMGLESLLHALALVKAAGPPFKMVIGGAGPLREPLEGLARGLGLDHAITFTGRVPDALLPAYYGSCDAFVLPTAEMECFGLILLEALACGRPVLATPVGAIPEIVGEFEPAWLASGTAPADIAGLLMRYLRGELPTIQAETLRRQVTQRYSAPIVLRDLVRTTLEID